MSEHCATFEIAAVLEVIDERLARIERAYANPKCESLDAHHAYTRTQAASLLSVSTWTIDRARKQGVLLEARRLGQRDVRITGESLLVFMTQREAASVRVRTL